jgi:hypothetical protein
MTTAANTTPLAYARPDLRRRPGFWRGCAIASGVFSPLIIAVTAIATSITSPAMRYLLDPGPWDLDRVSLVLIHTMVVPIGLCVMNVVTTSGFLLMARQRGTRLLQIALGGHLILLALWLLGTAVVTTNPAHSSTEFQPYHPCRFLSDFPYSLVGTTTLWMVFAAPALLNMVVLIRLAGAKPVAD